ncbi:MAG: aspartate carbamoyltransferase catalytic subunit [bacterium]|nr:aspartate carbamoyltransferase catalytic subunit [bacterium]
MDHFLEISQLSQQQIASLISRAFYFKYQTNYPSYAPQTVAQLFYENSTRTRVSFELAATRLAMSVVNLNLEHSSESKGEVLQDTIQNLAAMGIKYFVIRHQQEKIQQNLANYFGNTIHIINAGDGTHAHPSQALLDIMTIVEQKPQIDKLKVAVVGNIKHSRVANSLQCMFKQLGVGELVLVSPSIWQPQQSYFGRVTDQLNNGLKDADVIICLRVQRERLLEHEDLDLEFYRSHFALTQKTLRVAKPDCMIMHPGPLNRGVEIDSDVADGPQSFILEQVKNGVYARMAILEALILNQ